MRIAIDVSAGELLDRICILELKASRLAEPARSDVMRQLEFAVAVWDRIVNRSTALLELFDELRTVNLALWNVEEELRSCERSQLFAQRFVELARAVYKTNDRRAAIKRQIDQLLDSDVRDYKSYSLTEFEPEW